MNREGQFLVEFNLVMAFLVFPLSIGGSRWFYSELNRSKCAFESFVRARNQLISTNQLTQTTAVCGDVHETIRLLPLENLDHNKGSISIADFQSTASQLLEDASRSYQQLQGLVSAASESVSTK